MTAAVGRRLLAEYIGTGLLVAVVVGSGIAATRLTHDEALRLLVNSVVTALGLAVLILVFIPAGARTSGVHCRPARRRRDRYRPGRHGFIRPGPPGSTTMNLPGQQADLERHAHG